MKLRKLARLCEHDQLAPHVCPICGGTGYSSGTVGLTWSRQEPCSCVVPRCPGGVFLPPAETVKWCEEHGSTGFPDEPICVWHRMVRGQGVYAICRMVEADLIVRETP